MIYISVDVETDGPCPGLNSMLQIGAVAIDPAREQPIIAEWSRNLQRLEGAKSNADTMAWWNTLDPKVWEALQTNTVAPTDAMRDHAAWVESLKAEHGDVRFVAWPANFDWMFVCYYLHRFTGGCPYGYAALDMRSMLNGMLGWDGSRSAGDELPGWIDRGWVFDPWQHDALADARVQARQFLAMLRKLTESRSPTAG